MIAFRDGSDPAPVAPKVVQVLREIGVELRSPASGPASALGPARVDTVVVLGSEGPLPVAFGAPQRLDWPIPDPARHDSALPREEGLARLRAAREAIRVQLDALGAAEGWLARHTRPARTDELAGVRTLVRASGLPVAGLEEAFPAGYAVVPGVDGPDGAAGLEVHGSAGLLRSVAVVPWRRGVGLGRVLVEDRLHEARKRGLNAVFLLTTTAADAFARLGFARVPRDATPAAIRRSHEFASICPDSAVCMARQLR